MTAAVYRSTPSLSVPLSQNTAPVLEHNCLFTHDIRKKQKKWQDGFLRYHTFNKRIMVYDIPRNFIGDAHWTGVEAVQDGDELQLDKHGVLVQIAERIGQTETDLTELRKSTKKKSSNAGSSPVRPTPASTVRPGHMAGSRPATQLKHRSLNALLGTPKGPIGRAVIPTKSPFEERHRQVENEEWEDGRPPKRPRTRATPAWNASRTTTALPQSAKWSETLLWARTADAKKHGKDNALQAGQQRLATREVIDLSDDDDDPPPDKSLPGVSSVTMGPPTSPARSVPSRKMTAVDKPLVRSSSPAFQTQRTPPRPPREEPAKERSRLENAGSISVEEDGHPAPAKRASKTAPTARATEQRPSKASGEIKPIPPPQQRQRQNSSTKSGQVLRLSATVPRKKMLLCQDQLAGKSKRISSTNTDDAADSLLDLVEPGAAKQKYKTNAEKLTERLARIDRKGGSTSRARLEQPDSDATIVDDADVPMDEARNDDDHAVNDIDEPVLHDEDGGAPPGTNGLTSYEASALELSRLDRLMLPPAAPAKATPPLARKPSPPPKAAAPPPVKSAATLLPRREIQALRRVVSEIIPPTSSRSKRAPGAPVRYTPSPTKKSLPDPPADLPTKPPYSARPPSDAPRPRHKGPMQRAVSLKTAPQGASAVILRKPFHRPGQQSEARKEPEPHREPEAWSREAFDLFLWRPPGWDEEGWCLKAAEEDTVGGQGEDADGVATRYEGAASCMCLGEHR